MTELHKSVALIVVGLVGSFSIITMLESFWLVLPFVGVYAVGWYKFFTLLGFDR